MQIKTSNGFEYSYNPIDNSIVEGKISGRHTLDLRFKPLEAISSLPDVCSFTIGVTEQCNLRCSYCCYSGKYPEHRKHSYRKVSTDDIKSIIDFIVKYSCRDEIGVDFYGGESLLEIDWIKTFVQSAKKQVAYCWQFEVSTNGLLLTSDIVDWLVANQFNVFVSVDGIGYFHDICRKDKKGQPTYATIESNLSYIKEHYPDFWENNVFIMMTIYDISNLPEIADSWESSNLFQDKAPYRISEVSTIYNKNTKKIGEETELGKYIRLVEWFKEHPDNGVMKPFFTIWLSEWLERPILKLDHEAYYQTCVPRNRKLYIDASGNIGLCERITDTIRIGSVTYGIDYEKVNEVADATASFIDDNCSKCEIARVCDLCPDVLKISKDLIQTYCHNQKVMQKIKFRCFCELAESDLI